MASDEVLIEAYIETDIPADQLMLNKLDGDRFIEAVRRKTAEQVERDPTFRRIITLRKKGRLPRIRRSRK